MILRITILLLCVYFTPIQSVYHKEILWTAPNDLTKNSLFGYSIAFQSSSEGLSASKRILVGAPQAFNTGRVYSNDLNANVWEPQYIRSLNSSDEHPWLGASIGVGPSYYVTCAPRSTINYKRINKAYMKIMGGKCYIGNDKSNELQELPMITSYVRERNNSKETFSDTFGWNIHITRDNKILVGGPGIHESARGAVMLYTDPSIRNIPEGIKIFYYDVDRIKYNLGYSVSSGNYYSNMNDTLFAIGSTYGDTGAGKVIFIKEKKTVHSIEDTELGTMFAASLCSSDLDGDGRTDLLVGAPAAFREGEYDIGYVKVYLSDVNEKFLLKWTLWGSQSGGRFGQTILSIDRSDGDKREEIIIAAPYENDGRGALYLYSSQVLIGGKSPTYMQRIESSDIGYFGFSIAKFQDRSGKYGLAVGSPGEDKVAIIHHIPSFGIDIVLNNNLKDRTDFSSFEFETCLNLNYIIGPYDVDAPLEASVAINHQKATIAPDGGKTFSYNVTLKDITKKKIYRDMHCKTILVNTPKYGDYSKQITYKVKVSQSNDPRKESYNGHRALLANDPVSIQGGLWADTKCKNPGKCVPEFKLSWNTTLQENYMVGSTQTEQIGIQVENSGETAYDVTLRVEVAGVPLLKIPGSCVVEDRQRVRCDPRVIFNGDVWISGNIVLETSSITSQEMAIAIKVQLFNDKHLVAEENKIINLLYDSKGITVTGKTDRNVVLEATSDEVYNHGKLFEHTYLIMNNGITNWIDLNCVIHLEKQPYLLYKDIKIYTQQSALQYLVCPYKPVYRGDAQVSCNLGNLKKQEKIEIYVAMFVKPNKLGDILSVKNITIISTIELMDNRLTPIVDAHSRISTLLMMRKAVINWWIIIAGIMFGVSLLGFIVFSLYQCGFLKRKKKEDLQHLQRRASKRMSMRSSVRNSSRLSSSTGEDIRSHKVVDQRRTSVIMEPSEIYPDPSKNADKTD